MNNPIDKTFPLADTNIFYPVTLTLEFDIFFCWKL